MRNQARAYQELEEAMPAEGNAYISMEPNFAKPVTHGKRKDPEEDTEEGYVNQKASMSPPDLDLGIDYRGVCERTIMISQ